MSLAVLERERGLIKKNSKNEDKLDGFIIGDKENIF